MIHKSNPPYTPHPQPLTLPKSIELLSLYLKDYTIRMYTDFDAAILTALFVMRLLERGDLTYEPLP